MKLMEEDVRRVAAAAREAGEDLFCITGAMPGATTLAALFCDAKEPSLLALPGRFVPLDMPGARALTARFDPGDRFGFPAYWLTEGLLAADVRLLGDASFRAFCAAMRVRHILVPFADLADPAEYGGRRDYGWIGEFRAELLFDIRVTALFSEPLPDYGPFLVRFASPGCTVLDASVPPSLYAYETANGRKRNGYTLYLAEKRALRRVAVLFTNRREAEEFLRFLRARGQSGLYLNGAMTAAEQQAALEAFQRGEGILAATKSVLPYAPFARADAVIYCGVPYSSSFIARCASFSAEGELECCFCPRDFATDVNILKYFAGNLPEEEREPYLEQGLSRLLQVKNMIRGTEEEADQ